MIYGREIDDEYQRIDIVLLPCNYVHAEFSPGDPSSVSDDCIADLDQQIEYLGPIQWLIYYSEDVLRLDQFGSDAI